MTISPIESNPLDVTICGPGHPVHESLQRMLAAQREGRREASRYWAERLQRETLAHFAQTAQIRGELNHPGDPAAAAASIAALRRRIAEESSAHHPGPQDPAPFRPVVRVQPAPRARSSHRAAGAGKARDGDAGDEGEPPPPAARVAWARLRAAQVAFPTDKSLAVRLIWQAAQDLAGVSP